jgi:porin
MHYFYSIGVGGKGVIPGRPLDQFGIGYYYLDINNPKFTGRLATRSLLRDEYGFEAYYNCALTPWIRLTPNIQIVRPAQKEVVTSVATGGGIPPTITINKESIGTATVLGVRLQLIF